MCIYIYIYTHMYVYMNTHTRNGRRPGRGGLQQEERVHVFKYNSTITMINLVTIIVYTL